MDGDARLHVVVIDDHPIVALGLSQLAPGLEVVAAFPTVEDYLRRPLPDVDAVLLDLQLRADRADGTGPVMGTAAIRLLLDAGSGPVVIYTSIAEEMLLAACLAAGATGAVTKGAPGPTITEVVRIAARGMVWVDPSIAGALTRYARQRHAGALSPQQANALRYRGQGLKQQAIADKIGVGDPEIVNRYLKAAVHKLAQVGDPDAAGDNDRHPGAHIDDLARRSGLAGGLVRWSDLQRRRRADPGH